MATYNFSTLSDGQALSFDPTVDVLFFDQTSIAAGDLSVGASGADARIEVKSGAMTGKDITLLDTTPLQLAMSNVSFADASRLLFGDNAVAQNDNAASSLFGAGGRDLLSGFGGNDTLNGGSGNDWVEGGAGNDLLSGSGGQDSFAFREAGAANAETLSDFATNWDTLRLDLGGFAELGAVGRFAAGDARFWSAAGATSGHDADDRIVFNTTTKQLFYDADGSGAGASQLLATLSNGGNVAAGDIWVFGTPTSPPPGSINGTAGNDSILGTSGDDTINGLGGHDTVDGSAGDDRLDGGTGNDALRGNEGADTLLGGDGDDNLDGLEFTSQRGTVVESLDGGLGNDTFHVDHADDALADAGGIDTVVAYDISWTLGDGYENLAINNGVSESEVTGIGNALANVLDGGNSDSPADGWHVRLEGRGGNDTLFGSTQDDSLLAGDEGNDSIDGGGDYDVLAGGAGDDTLYGGADFHGDTMTGGTGADHFVLDNPHSAPAGTDRFTDYLSGTDRLQLDGNGFDDVGVTGDFAAGDERFFAGSAAHDASDRVIWDGSTLWYDADGTGAQAMEAIAFVQAGGTVVATDFYVVNGSAAGSTIDGTSGNDSLTGTAGDDTINGLGGHDTVDGSAGDDRLDGGTGNDALRGNEGADTLLGGDGDDNLDGLEFTSQRGTVVESLDGGLGNDTFHVDHADDALADAGGIDTVVAYDISWTLGDGFENLAINNGVSESEVTGIGNALANVLDGGNSDSPADGWRVRLEGRGGNDTIIGSVQEDALFGEDGDDAITGGQDVDQLDGGAGNDTLDGGLDQDFVTGGAGADAFIFRDAPGSADASDSVQDFLSGTDKLHLDAASMTALGASGNFGAGDERFFAGAEAHDGSDRVIWDGNTLWYDADGTGSTSQERIAFLQAGATVTATDIVVLNGSAPPPPPGGQVINGTAAADTLEGAAGNDTMLGHAGNDSIGGGGGNDQVSGNSGNDWVHGGDGNDTLSGGGGQDAFVFGERGAANADSLTDYAANWDSFRLDDVGFGSIGAAGRFASGDARFWAAAGANAGHDANDRIVFNTTSGQVWYDADGSGGGAAELIATLQPGAGMVAADVWVF